MDERLRLVAELQNKASAELRRLSKDMDGVKPTNGMVQARKWMDEFRSAGKTATEAVKPLPGLFSSLGVGGIAAGFAFGEMVKQFRDLADQIPTLRELGRQSGMSATEIKRLQYAAQMMHVDAAKMTGAVDTWSGKMVDFRRHTGRFYTEMLRQNGDLANKIAEEDPAQGFKDTLDFLARIPAAAQRAGASAADAVQIQKRWTEEALGDGNLAQMLARGPQGLADAYAEAAKNVAPITPELERQAESLNKSLLAFDQSWNNFKADVGPYVFNELKLAADDFRSVFDQIKSTYQWLQDHKEHPVQDAAKVADDSFNAHAKEAGERFRGEKPWGIGLPKTWTDDLGLTDPKKAWDPATAYWWSMRDIIGGAKRGLEFMNPIGSAHGAEAPAHTSEKSSSDGVTQPAKARPNVGVLEGAIGPSSASAKKDLTEAVKAGTLSAWREMALQQEVGAGADMGVGAPSMRYGRGSDGQYRRGGHSGGGRNYPDTPDGPGDPNAISGGTGSRALAAMRYLVDKKGWTPEGAAIAVGNAMQESQVTTGSAGDNGMSHAMFQWNHERWAAFQEYAQSRGKSTRDFETNLDFFDEERKRRSGLEAHWDKQTDLHNAGRLGKLYEGYAIEGRRVQNARDVLERYKRQFMHTPGPNASLEPIRIDIHHHQDGTLKGIRATSGSGTKIAIRSGATMQTT